MKAITFANPEFFWLFLLFPLLIAWQWFRRKKEVPAVSFSSLQQFSAVRTWRTTLRPLLYVLRGLALAALIVALARPRSSSEITKTKTTEGIDIILSIDRNCRLFGGELYEGTCHYGQIGSASGT